MKTIFFFLLFGFCTSSQTKYPVADFNYTTDPPRLDGIAGGEWENAKAYQIANVIDGPNPSASGHSAWFKGMYDEGFLYLFIYVTDATRKEYFEGTKEPPYDFDQGELYFDFNYTRPEKYFDEQTTAFEFFRGEKTLIDTHKRSKKNMVAETNEDGYWTQEIAIPLENLRITAPGNHVFGFDIHVNDGVGPGPRLGVIAWSDIKNTSWHSPRTLGKITLKSPNYNE